MNTSSVGRQLVAWAPLVAVLILVLPVVSAAQEPVKSFDQLNTRLKVGNTIYVTDAQGREIKGKIRDLGPSALTLDSDGVLTMPAEAVRVIERTSKPVKKGALWGLAVGAGLLVTWAAIGAQDPGEVSAGAVAGFIALPLLCAGTGAAVGAALPASRKEVYRAPGASGSARLSLAPVITPRTKGVTVSYSF